MLTMLFGIRPEWALWLRWMPNNLHLEEQIYGTASSNNEASSGSIHSSYNSYVLGSAATGFPSAIQSNVISKDAVFPERPGQLDCHYYMKTGDCKYGMTCRFNHPKERASSLPNCIISPLGLPLRQVSSLTFF